MTEHRRTGLNQIALFSGALALGAFLGAALLGSPKREAAAPLPASAPPRRSGLRALGLIVLGGVVTLVGMGVIAAVVAVFGFYNVSALSQDGPLLFRAIHFVATRSVDTRAKHLKSPALGEQDVERGLLLFDRECARCHAAPGKPPEAFSEGMNPNPPPLSQTGRDWTIEQIYWTVANGIHMTGMPAFAFRLRQADIWALAAFVKDLPNLTVEQYANLRDQAHAKTPPAPSAPVPHAPDARRGRIALAQYNCNGCHFIPGLGASAESYFGPSLAGVGARAYIAGTLANTAGDLAEFIMHPITLRPKGAMPDMRVTESDAADMVAYLRTLRTP